MSLQWHGLTLTRKAGERIMLRKDGQILGFIGLVEIDRGRIKLLLDLPGIEINREEVDREKYPSDYPAERSKGTL
jgi:sRNA-binding carbon storage regulator CsrA